jgi:hypothetical protein
MRMSFTNTAFILSTNSAAPTDSPAGAPPAESSNADPSTYQAQCGSSAKKPTTSKKSKPAATHNYTKSSPNTTIQPMTTSTNTSCRSSITCQERELASLVGADRRTIDRIRNGQMPQPTLRGRITDLTMRVAAKQTHRRQA